jgi:transposase
VEKRQWPYDHGMGERETKARVIEANRAQMRLVSLDLESMLPEDHQARAVWAFVERLDLGEFYARIEAREGKAGRPATDPRILLALWIYATVEGIGSAREIERLCRYHLAYQWICGGVNVNHHSLSDFRGQATDLLNGLLTQSVAMLMSKGLVELRRVAQDGMKVRASAGASSFRTRAGLNKLERIARQQVETLAREIDADPGTSSRRSEAARVKAAEDRERKIAQALEEMNEAEERKKSNNGKTKAEARTSTTDPAARVMKMADGGFRPAYNVHFVSDTATKVIAAVQVDNAGTDKHAMMPLAVQVDQRYGVRPEEWLTDGGCNSLGNVDRMAERECRVFAPLPKPRTPGRTARDPRPTDSIAVREWRARMTTGPAQAIYKERGATAELVNAHCRAQGLLQFLVRGTQKVLSVALLHALTHNMRRSWAFAAA